VDVLDESSTRVAVVTKTLYIKKKIERRVPERKITVNRYHPHCGRRIRWHI
jgi:hypothetical protein